MRRFFFTEAQRRDQWVTLGFQESRHIARVLRLKAGDTVQLLDGSGAVYDAEIADIAENVRLRITGEHREAASAAAKLYVGQGIIKTKKMELVLQKCTELGVDEVVPFIGARSQGNLIRQYEGKGERWRRIIDEACKQCRRPRPMILHDICPFGDLHGFPLDVDGALRLLLWEEEKNTALSDLTAELAACRSVVLLLGPEGGFSESEIAEAGDGGWRTVGLGTRILRSETAAIAAVAIVQHYLGNI